MYSMKFDRNCSILFKKASRLELFVYIFQIVLFYIFQIGASFSQTNVSCYVVDIQVNIICFFLFFMVLTGKYIFFYSSVLFISVFVSDILLFFLFTSYISYKIVINIFNWKDICNSLCSGYIYKTAHICPSVN